jgi:hypothetical protein
MTSPVQQVAAIDPGILTEARAIGKDRCVR